MEVIFLGVEIKLLFGNISIFSDRKDEEFLEHEFSIETPRCNGQGGCGGPICVFMRPRLPDDDVVWLPDPEGGRLVIPEPV